MSGPTQRMSALGHDGIETQPSQKVANDGQRTLVSAAPIEASSAPNELGPSQAASRYAVGEVIDNRYRLLDRLGRGGAGEVWVAEHTALKSKVAIKFLSDATMAGEHRDFMLERFRFEAQVSAQLGALTSDIVRVHDVGADDKGPFLVMEWIPGGSLDMIIHREHRLSPVRVARIIETIGHALEAGHRVGIAHRDLKPANVFVNASTGSAKLGDFGVAKAFRDGLGIDGPKATAVGVVIGTPDYMSPEQIQGNPSDHRVDMWALAIVAYEALTGVTPFEADTNALTMSAIVARPVHPLATFVGGLPPALDVWFEKALDKEASNRFASLDEMVEAFSRAARAPDAATGLVATVESRKPLSSMPPPLALPRPPLLPSIHPRSIPRRSMFARSSSVPPAPSILILPEPLPRRSWAVPVLAGAMAVAAIAMAALWGARETAHARVAGAGSSGAVEASRVVESKPAPLPVVDTAAVVSPPHVEATADAFVTSPQAAPSGAAPSGSAPSGSAPSAKHAPAHDARGRSDEHDPSAVQ